MTPAAAEELTERIRRCFGDVSILLLEAHDRRAWISLGHCSWGNYVRAEFGLSRSRSYEILQLARVNLALRRAAGGAALPPISGLAALQIKPVLDEVVIEVQQRCQILETGSSTGAEVQKVIQEIVDKARNKQMAPASGPEVLRRSSAGEASTSVDWLMNRRSQSPGARLTQNEVEALVGAINLIAGQIPATRLIGQLAVEDLPRLSQLPMAARWLGDLLNAWSARARVSQAFSAAAS
jgi:hypothetical protein